jgi:hypothetical protein
VVELNGHDNILSTSRVLLNVPADSDGQMSTPTAHVTCAYTRPTADDRAKALNLLPTDR